jgi:hypothetical protein
MSPTLVADRTIRVLAVAALVALIVTEVLVRAAVSATQLASFEPAALPNLLAALAGQTGLILAVATGVVSIVVSLQRGQRGWTIALLGLLVVAAYAGTLVPFAFPYLFQFPWVLQFVLSPDGSIDLSLFSIVPLALLPLGALFYARPRLTAPPPDWGFDVAPLAQSDPDEAQG